MRKLDKNIIFTPLLHTESEEIRFHILQRQCRSAWDKGVTETAIELLQRVDVWKKDYKDNISSRTALRNAMLNGAKDWKAASWSGCYLIYDCEIAERFCNPSELKKTKGGERRPNAREEWLDVQARALYQAARKVLNAADAAGLFKKEGAEK